MTPPPDRRPDTLRDPSGLVAEVLRGGDHVVAVTGATGWLGAVAMDLLYAAFGNDAPERVVGYASRERTLALADGRSARIRPLGELSAQEPSPTLLLHFAFVPRDREAEVGHDAYVRENVSTTALVLDAIAGHRPSAVVLASSGAVYGPAGRLQSDLAGHAYGALKHLDEQAVRCATQDVGGTYVIPRIFSVGGARVARPDVYALASMVAMAASGGPITVRASHPVVRTYCGVDEVVALSIWAAVRGISTVFDTCGTPVELGDLALMVAREHGLDDSAVHRLWDPEAEPDRYVGDGRSMTALAAQAGLRLRPLGVLVRESARSLAAPADHGTSP